MKLSKSLLGKIDNLLYNEIKLKKSINLSKLKTLGQIDEEIKLIKLLEEEYSNFKKVVYDYESISRNIFGGSKFHDNIELVNKTNKLKRR